MTAPTVEVVYGRKPPKAWKYKETMDCTYPDLIVGLELEVENCRMSAAAYIDIGSPLGIDVKGDGSLRVINGREPYEFITKPMMMQNALPILNTFFDKTKFDEENYSDRCSIHVHANCCDMTLDQVSAVGLIYTVVEPILFEFVNQRPGNKDGWSRDTNIYCVPWNQCRDHLNLVYNFAKNPGMPVRHWQKYTALNLLPLARFGTMEWRHMHGTSDMKKITQWLNIIGAIYKHAKITDFETLVKDIQGLNSVSHYGQFFNTVLGGQLPYTDVYKKAMEEGCILAKYSMINWSLEKKNPEKFKTALKPSMWEDIRAQDHDDEVEDFVPAVAREQIVRDPRPDPILRVNTARRPPPERAMPAALGGNPWARGFGNNIFAPPAPVQPVPGIVEPGDAARELQRHQTEMQETLIRIERRRQQLEADRAAGLGIRR